mmetsp:Transcript_21530/g.54089  ORF Transcript_21530/g.54089 Transcript_21530/m.54089 type:complete len:720 (-) Transcript_21530:213-2372(-)|eukprot:CAMPEP_0173433932 /NCGR_PEP_ID=MMETSP1357-20121228/11189_1 /TAXON_ID=77926 /ORGANISM="Hemiselmis rufescens, Strain PCC563" /LENGTH=719 /DNA_ID=CAMNT_0014398679 /DNA_START=156 /DNA_END=2315 /DNA_ORIENTATION=-
MNHNVRLQDLYELRGLLGKGNYGEVWQAQHKETGELFAAKSIIQKENWSAEEFNIRIDQEVTTHQMVSQKNIIQLYHHLRDAEEDGKHWVIMQLATGGELMQRLLKKFVQGMRYTEKEVAAMVSDVLHACAHMHERCIVHCDLKPDNILYAHEGPDSWLCVADFGFAQLCEDTHLTKYCGTLDYMAPELLVKDKRYNDKADVWSVGCLMYVLLSGALPFRRDWGNLSGREQEERVKTMILSGVVEMKEASWTQVQDSTKQLLSQMLSIDPDKRPSAAECLQHPWFQGEASETTLANVVGELRNKNSSRGLFGVSSHSMASILAQNASQATLAALGAQNSDIEARFQEGGIQALVSLGWSQNREEQSSCFQTLANSARGNPTKCLEIIEQGGVRMVCNRAMKAGLRKDDSTMTLYFGAALLFNNIADNPSLRLPLATEHTRHKAQDSNNQALPVLVHIAMAGVSKPQRRVYNNAVCALARLGHDPSLQDHLIDLGAVPLMALVADPAGASLDPFGKTAMSCLEYMLRQAHDAEDVRKRALAVCAGACSRETLERERETARQAVEFHGENLVAVTARVQDIERRAVEQIRRGTLTKEQIVALYQDAKEQKHLAHGSVTQANVRLVKAEVALTVCESHKDASKESPVWRTIRELDARVQQHEPTRKAFEAAGIMSLESHAVQINQGAQQGAEAGGVDEGGEEAYLEGVGDDDDDGGEDDMMF